MIETKFINHKCLQMRFYRSGLQECEPSSVCQQLTIFLAVSLSQHTTSLSPPLSPSPSLSLFLLRALSLSLSHTHTRYLPREIGSDRALTCYDKERTCWGGRGEELSPRWRGPITPPVPTERSLNLSIDTRVVPCVSIVRGGETKSSPAASIRLPTDPHGWTNPCRSVREKPRHGC